MGENRIWRVKLLLRVPKYTQMSPDGDPPNKLEFHSRMPGQTRAYDGITIAIQKPVDGPIADAHEKNPQVELIWLVMDVPAGASTSSAVERLAPSFETLIDLITFDMGTQLGLGQMEIIDVTPPLAIGEDRAIEIYNPPPFQQQAQAVEMEAIQGRLIGQLPDSLEIDDPKTAAVLRWFVKSLATNLLHDQFIFLWIALEILCDASEIKVEEPYVGRCGHEIKACPECGKPTTRMVRGATIRAYLREFGVTEEMAKRLWRMRQIMHGAISPDSEKLSDFSALVQSLRAVVTEALKMRLGRTPVDPPMVADAGFSIHPSLGLYGNRPLVESDIKPLA